MVKRIYVGNLAFSTSEAELSDLFAQHGTVRSVKVITDRETGKSRGFAFVEMEGEEADKAIAACNGAALGGRNLRVNEARERERGPRRDARP